jgi:ubiquinone/menaquinone biosynthesis C-methylase UbiE
MMREWEKWQDWSKDYIKVFLRDGVYGVEHPMRKEIRKTLKKLGVKSVLDVGCGPGVDYEGYKKAGLNLDYVGIDITPKMIEVCKEKFPEAKFHVGDIYNLRFPDASFDAVVCKDVLCHLPEYDSALQELYRVSKDVVIIGLFIPMDEESTKVILDRGFLNIKYNINEFLGVVWKMRPRIMSLESVAGHLLVLRK